MKKFNAEEALKGAPVKLRNGQKAYIEKYNEGVVFVYSGYVDNENETIATWTKEGAEYCFVESQRDIVSMWSEDEDKEANLEANLEANIEADQEENIFEKALDKNLPLRHISQSDNVPNFHCIAKTRDGDYILECEDRGTNLTTRLSSLSNDLEWYIVVPKLPKAFRPKEGETFWFISPTVNTTIAKDTFSDDHVFYRGVVKAGLAFKTQKEAEDALRFLRSNIEVNHGKEQK